MYTTVAGFTLAAALLSLGLFAGMLGALALGQRVERLRVARGDAKLPDGVGVINGAVFALLGLLIAFTFSGAATRFEARRALIVEEANAIGTAYLRLDLLLPDARARLQEEFRQYLDVRLLAYQSSSVEAFRAAEAHSFELQGGIWRDAVAATKEAGLPVAPVLLPAINEAIDITTTRSVALENHPPAAIYVMLIVLALMSALLAGGALSSTDPTWVPKVAFAATMAVTIYLTLDLEFPRLGLIRVVESDHVLADLRKSMR
jgi:hypothetical protein